MHAAPSNIQDLSRVRDYVSLTPILHVPVSCHTSANLIRVLLKLGEKMGIKFDLYQSRQLVVVALPGWEIVRADSGIPRNRESILPQFSTLGLWFLAPEIIHALQDISRIYMGANKTTHWHSCQLGLILGDSCRSSPTPSLCDAPIL